MFEIQPLQTVSAEEIRLFVLLCENPLRGEKSEIPPDGLTSQQMAFLALGEGVGPSHSPYKGNGCYVVYVELHYIFGTC